MRKHGLMMDENGLAGTHVSYDFKALNAVMVATLSLATMYSVWPSISRFCTRGDGFRWGPGRQEGRIRR